MVRSFPLCSTAVDIPVTVSGQRNNTLPQLVVPTAVELTQYFTFEERVTVTLSQKWLTLQVCVTGVLRSHMTVSTSE